ncbi:C40 family peptidase [Flavobacterium sp. K5-23]|nr:C40 family peptidase [Flavobacterium sp. K5-23]
MGGTTKSGFDCSGLMCVIFDAHDINLPRTSYKQSKVGFIIDQEKEEVKKGDLVFFKTGRRKKINHVGMVVDVTEDDVKFIHSSSSRGVMISSLKETYFQNAFAQLNRILN